MGGGERGNCVCMMSTDVHLSSVRVKSTGVARDTFPNIGFHVAMSVKSHRGDGEMSTLNMLTGHVLHTPGHAPWESQGLKAISTSFYRIFAQVAS